MWWRTFLEAGPDELRIGCVVFFVQHRNLESATPRWSVLVDQQLQILVRQRFDNFGKSFVRTTFVCGARLAHFKRQIGINIF